MNATIRQLSLIGLAIVAVATVHAQEATNTKPEKERAQLVIFNAAEVEDISLLFNSRVLYENMRPGSKTSGGAIEQIKGQYTVLDKKSKVSYSQFINLTPDSRQILFILGDFTLVKPDESGLRGKNESKESTPNVMFSFLDLNLTPKESPYRYRIFNGLIKSTLKVEAEGENPIELETGQTATFSGKPTAYTILVKTMDQDFPLKIVQDPPYQHATFAFYSKNGKAAYKVIAQAAVPEPQD